MVSITCWHFVSFFLKEGYWHFVVFKYFLGFSYSHEINSLSGFFFFFFSAAFIVIIITATATYLLVYNLVIYVFLDMCRAPEQGPSGTYNIWFDIFIYILTFSRVLIINFLFAAFLVTLAFYVLISWQRSDYWMLKFLCIYYLARYPWAISRIRSL